MTENVIKKYLKKLSQIKHKHCGLVDNGFRMGNGCEEWYNNYPEKYSGQFLYNNLHGRGIYQVDATGDQTYFDGLFYANTLEGYGKVIYPDGTTFEGLFKRHIRFGPGVSTCTDKTQDVGLWHGFSLMKLSVPVGDELVPHLGRTLLGKARLLQFRKLVPACIQTPDRAKQILIDLEANEEVLAQSNELYNLHIRNPDSIFFNKKVYDEKFFTQQDCTIEVVLSREEFESEMGEECEEEEVSSEEDSPTICCSCIQPNFDKLTNMCVQLHEVEIKLERLITQLQSAEEQMSKCKHCCEYVMMMKSNILDAKRRSDERHYKSLELKKSKLISFMTLHTNVRQSEDMAVQRYFLPSSVTDFGEHEMQASQLFHVASVATLPFSVSSCRFKQTLSLDSVDDGEGDIVDYSKGTQTCFCKHLLIEDIDILKNKLDKFKKEQLFYSAIKNNLKTHIDVEFERLQQLCSDEVKYVKTITVSDLVAWNNEELWTLMLQFCFCHRRSENNVSFVVADVVTGLRDSFQLPGIYEKSCISFLNDCLEGCDQGAFNLLRTYNINPDLCDIRGNTGMMLATVNDQIKVIGMLVNCGGKVDSANDEGLTPLTICLLRYLAVQEQVKDWEQAFLQEPNIDNEDLSHIRQWRPVPSISTVTDTATTGRRHRYVFDTSFIKSEHRGKKSKKKGKKRKKTSDRSTTSSKKTKKSKTRTKKTSEQSTESSEVSANSKKKTKKTSEQSTESSKRSKTKGKKNKGSNKSSKSSKRSKKSKEKKTRNGRGQENAYTDEELEKLKIIKKTTMVLLKHGADPNIGEVPLKPLFLAAFTDDYKFMRGMLENKADPNTQEDNLTCLHVIVSQKLSAEKLKMCAILLSFHADPNIRTSSEHWSELKNYCLGDIKNPEIVDEGKNVLHMLTLREDFVDDPSEHFGILTQILVNNGCRTSDLYLGHTPFSLAVLRGNHQIIEALLETKRVDPYQLLGYDMGNALTVLVLKRFAGQLLLDQAKQTVVYLVDHGFNPLHSIGDFENAIAFMEYENVVKDVEKPKTKKGKKGKNKSKNSTKLKKSGKKATTKANKSKKSSTKPNKSKNSRKSKKSKKSKGSKKSNKSKKERAKLEAYIKHQARMILFKHLECKSVEYLYILMTETMFADPLIVMLSRFVNPDKILAYIDLIFQHGIIEPDKFSYNVIEDLLGFVLLEHKRDSDEEKIKKMINLKEWSAELPKNEQFIYLGPPEVDPDADKYKVCFQCLRGKGKKLLTCPNCELVYFCSQKCNVLDAKAHDYHKCKEVFYDTVNEILGDEEQPSRLGVLLNMAEKVRNERLAMFELQKLQDKLSRLKFASSATRKKGEERLLTFQKLKKAKEEFGKMNRMWDYQQIFQKPEEDLDSVGKESSPLDKYYEFNVNRVKITQSNLPELFPHVYRAYSKVLRKTTSYGPDIFHNIAPAVTVGAVIGPDVHSYDQQLNPKSGDDMKEKVSVHEMPAFVPKSRRPSNFGAIKRSLGSQQRQKLSGKMRLSSGNTSQHKTLLEFSQMDQVRMIDNVDNATGYTDFLNEKQKSWKMRDKGYYMTFLSKIFADFNLPLLLLPYACFRDGQVYYSMSGNVHFGKTFQQLHLPD